MDAGPSGRVEKAGIIDRNCRNFLHFNWLPRAVCCFSPSSGNREIMPFWPTAWVSAGNWDLVLFAAPPLGSKASASLQPVFRFLFSVPPLPSFPRPARVGQFNRQAPGIRGLLSARLVGPSLQVAAPCGGAEPAKLDTEDESRERAHEKHPCVC